MSSSTNNTTAAEDREAAAVLTKYQKALTGLQNDIPATQAIVYNQTSYTATTFLPVLQAGAAPLQAVVSARSTLTTALTNRHTAFEGSVALIDAFYALLPQILPPGTDVTKFGASPKKPRTPLTVEQKAAANAKRAATRAARHIMGKKQRAAIQAPATTAPAPATTGSGTAAAGSTTTKTGP